MTAHEGVRFLLSVGNGLRAVPIQPGQKKGNGTQAVPYKMSRDTRPRVSVKTGSAARTPREGCPYGMDLEWSVLRNGR